jgi:hypothetical protein
MKETFQEYTARMLSLAEGSDPLEEFDRFGMHAERGKESVRHMMRMLAGHDRNHLTQIERLLAEKGQNK